MIDLSHVKGLLFTPGTRPDRFAKAEATRASGVIIDLEDAVGPGDKDGARAAVAGWFRGRTAPTRPGFLVCVRINSVYTGAGLRDLLMLTELLRDGITPDAVVLPKVESAVEVGMVARHLQNKVALITLIESALGLEQAMAIAAAAFSVRAVAFGGVDLAADLRCELAWEPLLAARARVVQAAASRGLGALDVPYLDIDDAAGLAAECARARAMGFSGKLAIHPSQADAIADAFTPSAAQVEHAQGVLDSYTAAGGGVCTYRGKMIDEPVVLAARHTLARAAGATQ